MFGFKFFKKKVGLVLGSGTARGLAHIGVLKVFEKEKIHFDFLSGSSIGALIGAIYSLYQDVALIEKEVTKVDWLKVISFVHFGYGHGGLLDNQKVAEFIRHFVGQKTFRDLKIPLAIVAVDLEKGTPVIFRQGPLFEAIRASIALPGLFSPVKVNDRVLVDGGMISPLPLKACCELGAREIIAVNLFADLKNSFQKFLLFEEKGQLASVNVATQAFFIMENELANLEAREANLIIAPFIGRIDWFDFTQASQFIAAGEKAALEVIEQVKKIC